MQVSVENTGKLGRRLTVSVPAAQLENVVGTRVREMAKTAKINGFRPGKVPAKVIEQRYGAQIRAEAYNELVRRTFNDAVREQKLTPATSPEFKTESDDQSELRYSAAFEVIPEFGKIDVSTLSITRLTSVVEEADIEQMLETLRQQRRTWQPVERAAQNGDLANIETVAEVDGKREPEQGARPGATVIGSGALLPEIEAGLVGMSVGETKQISVKMPAQTRDSQLAGKDAHVTVTLQKVSEPVIPEIDEAFIKSFGVNSGDIEQFRAEVRSNLERELKGALMNKLRAEVATKLIEAYKEIDLPTRLIDGEARALAENETARARERGQADAQFNPADFQSVATRRVAAALLVGEIARQNDIRLDMKRVTETMQLIASTYEDPPQVIELYRQDPQLLESLRSRVMEEQVIDWIAERANAQEKPVSFSEAIRPAG